MTRLNAQDVLEIIQCRSRLAVQQGSQVLYTTNNIENFDDAQFGPWYLDEPHRSFLSSDEDSSSENDKTSNLSSPQSPRSNSPSLDASDYDIKPTIPLDTPLRELQREARQTAERYADERIQMIEGKFRQISLEFRRKIQDIRENQRTKIKQQQSALRRFEKESLEIAQSQLQSLRETKPGESVEHRILKAEQAKKLAEQQVLTKVYREQANALHSQLQNLLAYPKLTKVEEKTQLIDQLLSQIEAPDIPTLTLLDIVKSLEALKDSVEQDIQQLETARAQRRQRSVDCIVTGFDHTVSKFEPPKPAHPEPVKPAAAEAGKGSVAPITHISQDDEAAEPQPGYDDSCSHTDIFQEYMRLNNLIGEAEKRGRELVASNEGKALKMELMKAVNININAISVHSGTHLMAKYRALDKIIAGGTVTVGGRPVTTRGEDNPTIFACNLLASKLVAQADEQVSVRAETAIPLGCVGAGLMNPKSSPTFAHLALKDLILAHLYAQCPYLVPYYPPKIDGQTAEQHYDSLGYKVVNGNIESQALFVKRQAGLARLFAALFIAPLPGGSPNPSLPVVWRYLVSTLNLAPRAFVTATVMHAVLEVSGSALYQVYGSIFYKLIEVAYRSFIPRIRKVTPEEVDGGATQRLQLFIENALKKKRIDAPKGALMQSFWVT